eukprot:GILI01001805.1.p1 GENE.GILI01001805.1~~GILI01001805.1.p1  ORF type:complete len:415 (+),score=133.48 GILI01001805.1:146-1390(+)
MDTKPQQSNEILIEDRLYDITGFKHPGGSIMKFYQGSGDATEAFNEFHTRSAKATKMLRALPNRAAPHAEVQSEETERLQKLSREYAKFRRELEIEGWFKPSISHSVYRSFEIIFIFALAVFLLTVNAKMFFIPAAMLAGIGTGRSGWWMHEGGHVSITGNFKVDHRLQEFFFGVGSAMSASWWRVQHNKHHCAPQKLQHDVDLDTLPLVAFNSRIVEKAKKNKFIKFWIPLQNYLFGPVTCFFVATFWQIYLHPRHMNRTKRYNEMFCVALRYLLTFVIGKYLIGASIGAIIGFHFLSVAFGGSYIFTNFALSHTHLPVLDKDKHAHWTEYGADYTIDITPHWFTNWWMGYLNYQIEHHLFPCMPQYRFVKLAPRVRAFFKANGLKYDCRDYFAAMHDTFSNLKEVGEFVSAP